MSLAEEDPKKRVTEKTVKKQRKKKEELKENQFDLGHGFILTIVKHPIGDMNGNLEGFLAYQGDEIEIENKRFYGENTEAIKDFDNRIIPEFISKNNIKVFKYLDDEYMFKFVKEYLLKNRHIIKYGCVLDIIKILAEHGYEIPVKTDKVTVENLRQFHNCVNRLSREFRKHLVMFNFTADRDVNNTKDHPNFEKHDDCRNIVFTRFPWSNGFKALSVIDDFVTYTSNDLRVDVEMETFKNSSPEMHSRLDAVFSIFNKTNLRTKETLVNIDYGDIKKEFKSYYKQHKKELIEFWCNKQPDNYGVYPEE